MQRRLFHVFAEAKVRRFTASKDTRPFCTEVNAGQTLKDKFWQVVCWLYNYWYQTDWFHPVNAFKDKVKKVASINLRPILGQVHRLSGAQCRVWYQVTAGIYPTQAYLARIGLAITDRCEFCLGERETTGHFTN